MIDETRPLKATIDRPTPEVARGFSALATTEIADVLELSQVMRYMIHPLWGPNLPRIAGPAFTVKTGRHDNLMFHASIYLAQPGDIIVVEAGDDEMAVAGGNVCAIARRRGVIGLIVDGVIRDVGESHERRFPLFGRGRVPIPGKRVGEGYLNEPIRCGGVTVHPGDIVIADEEGIVVVPHARAEELLKKAQAKRALDSELTLDQWEQRHRAGIETALRAKGYRLLP